MSNMAMPDAKCIRQLNHSRIKVEDNGMSACFANDDRADHRVYRVDGCLVTNVKAADNAVEHIGVGLVVVEFKGGGDVEGALKQIDSSVRYFRKDRDYRGKIGSIIVSRECPMASATIARHRAKFAKDHNGASLHVVSSARQFTVEKMLRNGRM